MTTPSGTIAASDVNVELGKSPTATMSLNDSDVRTLAGVGSGQISFADLRNKSSVIITLNETSYYAYQAYSSSTCHIRINADGYVQSGFNGFYTNEYLWCDPTSAASDYEVFATEVNTSLGTFGTFGQWIDCSTSPMWFVFTSVPVEPAWSFIQLNIRKKTANVNSASAQVYIEAERLF